MVLAQCLSRPSILSWSAFHTIYREHVVTFCHNIAFVLVSCDWLVGLLCGLSDWLEMSPLRNLKMFCHFTVSRVAFPGHLIRDILVIELWQNIPTRTPTRCFDKLGTGSEVSRGSGLLKFTANSNPTLFHGRVLLRWRDVFGLRSVCVTQG